MKIQMMTSKNEIGPVVNTKQGIYVITTKAEIGIKYLVKCPVCGNEIDIVATKEEAHKVKCVCNAIIAFVGKKGNTPSVSSEEQKTTTPSNEEKKFLPTDKLEKRKKDLRKGYFQWGIWPFRHSYMLNVGCNTIGRLDDDCPSDIQLKDTYVSRRSVDVKVTESPQGYTFQLSVKKATNPIYVNGKEHAEGTSVYLNNGDTVVLGATKLRFCLEEKKK